MAETGSSLSQVEVTVASPHDTAVEVSNEPVSTPSGSIEIGAEAGDVAQDDDEGDPTDAIERLAQALEHLGERIDQTQTQPTTHAPAENQKAQTLGRRVTSAFRRIWSKPSAAVNHDCVACQEPISSTPIRVPCGHTYDSACITSLFHASTYDESLFPPRCCQQPIPLSSVQAHFFPALVGLVRQKEREFGCVRRVYCAKRTCSRFLGPQVDGPTGTWLSLRIKSYACACGTRTCKRCRRAYENGVKHLCGDGGDEGMEVVLELGKKEGWARCPGCRALIELNRGCYHMTCLCKAEFCYLCEAQWKTCECPQWDEDRLVAAAEERVDMQFALMDAIQRPALVLARWGQAQARNRDRNNGAAARIPVPPQPNGGREELVRAAVDELRVNHDCRHEAWRYRDGGGRCVGCFDYLDRYVFHCMDCHTIACNRCRLNRF